MNKKFFDYVHRNDLKGLKTMDVYKFAESTDEMNRTPLFHAIYNQRDEIVKYLLLHHPANVNKQSKGRRSPLNLAVSMNRLDYVGLLLGYLADVECRDVFERTPIHIASYRGFLDIIELLLEKGANPNVLDKNGNTPITGAANEEVKQTFSDEISSK